MSIALSTTSGIALARALGIRIAGQVGGSLYSLARYSLQTDRDNDVSGDADIIDQSTLNAGFVEAGMFERDPSYFRFIVDSDGATTSGSSFPRCELRDETEYTQDVVSEYKVAARVIELDNGVSSVFMQCLDILSGSSAAAFKVEVRGGTPSTSTGRVRFKYDPTYLGTEEAFNLVENIAVDANGQFTIPPIRIRRGPDSLQVWFGANVDGETPDWQAGDPTPIGAVATTAFSRTPAANFGYYWKSGNYLQDSSTAPAIQATIDHIAGTWAAPRNVSAGEAAITTPATTAAATGTLSGAGAITVTPSILIEASTDAAPKAVWFTASISGQDASGPGSAGTGTGATYDPRLHDCYYFWDFYDAGGDDSYTWQHPVNAVAGPMSTHATSRYDYGPVVAHVYRQKPASGTTYTVRCTVIEPSSGKTGEGTVTVTVADQDTEFATTQTIYLDPVGGGTAPTGATTETYTDIASALQDIDAQETTQYRIMLANTGGSFTLSGPAQYGNGTDLPPAVFIVGQPGGTRPSVTVTGSIGWNDKTSATTPSDKVLVIQGIDFTGPFDPTSNPPTGGGINGIVTVYQNGPEIILLDDVSVGGMGMVYLPNSDPNRDHRCICINDSENTSWRTYGILAGDKAHVAILGSAMVMDPDAYSDATDTGGSSFRFTDNIDTCHIYASDFFARTSKDPGSGGGKLQTANTTRGATADTSGATFNWQASYFEGGNSPISFTPTTGSGPMNCIIDKCISVGDAHVDSSAGLIETFHGGTSIRNCLLLLPELDGDYTNVESVDATQFIQLENANGTSDDNYLSPINIYNNTCVNRRTDSTGANGPTMTLYNADGGTPFSNINFDNNVIHQTDIGTPQEDFAPLGDDTNFIAPYNTGYITSSGYSLNNRFPNYATSDDQRSNSAVTTTAGLLDRYDPESGSSAIGGGLASVTPADDATGKLRSTIRSDAGLSRTAETEGWLEVALES